MTLLNSVQNISVKPFDHAIGTIEPYGDVSCGQSIKARALFVIQAIVSLVALPIILLLGVFSLAVRTCQGEGKVAANELWDSLKMHIAVVLPTSLIGPFIPLSATLDVLTTLSNCSFPNAGESEESLNSGFDFPGAPPGGPGYLAGRYINQDSTDLNSMLEASQRRLFAMHPEFREAARSSAAERNDTDSEIEDEERPTGARYLPGRQITLDSRPITSSNQTGALSSPNTSIPAFRQSAYPMTAIRNPSRTAQWNPLDEISSPNDEREMPIGPSYICMPRPARTIESLGLPPEALEQFNYARTQLSILPPDLRAISLEVGMQALQRQIEGLPSEQQAEVMDAMRLFLR